MNNFITRAFFNNHILVALVVVVFGWFLLQIREVLIALFIAYIIMAALHPLADFFQRFKLPRAVAVAITFVLVLAVLILLILPLIPFFTAQIQSLIKNLPLFINQAATTFGLEFNVGQFNAIVQDELGNITRNAFQVTSQVFGGVFALLTILVLGFYLLLDRNRIKKETIALFGKRYQKHVELAVTQSEEKLGSWVRGQFLLSVAVGTITWIVLTLLGLDYALPLALLAGLLEIVPTIGPIIAAIPAVIVALSVSGPFALVVAGAYVFIQILENNLLVPRIMSSAVGLNPIVVIVAVIAGGKLLGVLGALLAVPFVTLIIIFIKTITSLQHDN